MPKVINYSRNPKEMCSTKPRRNDHLPTYLKKSLYSHHDDDSGFRVCIKIMSVVCYSKLFAPDDWTKVKNAGCMSLLFTELLIIFYMLFIRRKKTFFFSLQVFIYEYLSVFFALCALLMCIGKKNIVASLTQVILCALLYVKHRIYKHRKLLNKMTQFLRIKLFQNSKKI